MNERRESFEDKSYSRQEALCEGYWVHIISQNMAGNISNSARDGMLKDLTKILSLSAQIVGYKDQIMTFNGKWVTTRRETLKVVDDLLKDMESSFKVTSIARAGGAGVGVAGGAAALVGYGLSFSPNPAVKLVGRELVNYGGGAAVLGGLTAGTACVVESWLSQNKMDKIQNALREDQFQTTLCLPWYQRSQELEQLFQRVFGCSIVSETWRDLNIVLGELNLIRNRGGETILNVIEVISRGGNQLVEEGYNLKNVQDVIEHASDTTLRLLREFCTDPRVREAVLSICAALRNSPIVFEIMKVGINIAARAAIQEGIILLILPAGAQATYHAAAQMMQGLLVAITLAITVWSLVSAIKDIKQGGNKNIKMIKDVQACLKSELDCLLKQFPNLK